MSSEGSRLPKALYRAAQVRELDRIAIQECGIDGFNLMHKAASTAFSALLDKWPQVRHLLVFTGTGNNGGDGYVIAGLAREHGLNPEVIQLGDHGSLTGDARRARDFAEQRDVVSSGFHRETILGTGSYPRDHTVIVDALLGTGLDRPVDGVYAQAIETINALPFPVLSVDIPSGLSADTGKILGVAVEAALTVSFIGMKQGLLTADGVDVAGQLVFSNLDVPDRVFREGQSPVPASHRIDMHQAAQSLRPRSPSAHKGNFGHTVVVGGDYGFGGATLMAAASALRVGSGLVSVVTRSVNRSGLLAKTPEIMMLGTEDPDESEGPIASLLERATVIVIGPGLGRSDWSRELLRLVFRVQQLRGTPLVVDADGLNLLASDAATADTGAAAERTSAAAEKTSAAAGRTSAKAGHTGGAQDQESEPGAQAHYRDNWILTPHPGEAARLLGCETAEISSDRFAAVRNLQARWGGVILLKGAGSLICAGSDPDAPILLCNEGNPGMASGGMGDILSGLIGGLVAQRFSLSESLKIAVCVHGEAADLAAAELGQRGMAATDLLPYVQKLVNPPL